METLPPVIPCECVMGLPVVTSRNRMTPVSVKVARIEPSGEKSTRRSRF